MGLQITNHRGNLGHEVDCLSRVYDFSLRKDKLGLDLAISVQNALQLGQPDEHLTGKPKEDDHLNAHVCSCAGEHGADTSHRQCNHNTVDRIGNHASYAVSRLESVGPERGGQVADHLPKPPEAVLRDMTSLPGGGDSNVVSVKPQEVLCVVQSCTWEPGSSFGHTPFGDDLCDCVSCGSIAPVCSSHLRGRYGIYDVEVLPQITPEGVVCD